MKRKVFIFFNIVILIFSNICVVFADEKSDLKNEQNNIDKKIEETNSEIAGVKSQMSEALNQINRYNSQIGSYENEISDLTNQIDVLSNQIEEKQSSIDEQIKKFNEQQELLNKRLVAMYESGSISYLDMLLSSSNLADFISKYYIIEQLAEYDTDLLNGIDVVDCTGGRALNRSDIVRVFRISEVKGVEFEVAFFYNLDEALHGRANGVMKKYLYVGISRATTHLAATFCNKDDASEVLRFFDTKNNNWKM